MRYWQAFVLASKFLTRPVITALELQKADLMLLQFCEKFEQLYGKSKIKPNMHLHGHLKECVLHYGPIYNFFFVLALNDSRPITGVLKFS